jgi:hypothetical protein
MGYKPKVPFKSSEDEATAIDAKVAAMRLNLQMSPHMSTMERIRIAELICDAQKMALRLRIQGLTNQ